MRSSNVRKLERISEADHDELSRESRCSALGASAVQVGTSFVFCSEANIPPPYRRALRVAQPDQTAVTNVFTGRPVL